MNSHSIFAVSCWVDLEVSQRIPPPLPDEYKFGLLVDIYGFENEKEIKMKGLRIIS